jgi:hypothetical protein
MTYEEAMKKFWFSILMLAIMRRFHPEVEKWMGIK